MHWLQIDDGTVAALTAFLASLGMGLLIGVERERNPSAKAGLRTFALTALFGTMAAMLGEKAGSGWVPAAGLVLVGLTIVAAYRNAPDPNDPGTTTVVALLVAYSLGAMSWYGERTVAVMLAIATTALLYFKPELRGLLERFTRRDLLSVLQFAALSFVILPILPNESFGPFRALNPHQIWLMVVLVSGLSLAGYIALRIVGVRRGLALVGLFGGLVSSTATTLAYSRHARATGLTDICGGVILAANLVVLVRLTLMSAIVAPAVLPSLAPVLAAALVAGGLATFLYWRRHFGDNASFPMPEIKNPTELGAAFGFGALFAAVLFCAAWLSDAVGSKGLYAVALVSGLTDVDALTLSTLRLYSLDRLGAHEATAAIGLAVLANVVFKFGMMLSVGGRALARQVMLPFGASVAAGILSYLVLHGRI